MPPNYADWDPDEAAERIQADVTFEGLSEQELLDGAGISRWSKSGKTKVIVFCAKHQISRRNHASPEQRIDLMDSFAVFQSGIAFENASKKLLSFIDRTVVGGAIGGLQEIERPDGWKCTWYAVSEGWFKNADCDGNFDGRDPPRTNKDAWRERVAVPQRHVMGYVKIIQAAVEIRAKKLKQIALQKIQRHSYV